MFYNCDKKFVIREYVIQFESVNDLLIIMPTGGMKQ